MYINKKKLSVFFLVGTIGVVFTAWLFYSTSQPSPHQRVGSDSRQHNVEKGQQISAAGQPENTSSLLLTAYENPSSSVKKMVKPLVQSGETSTQAQATIDKIIHPLDKQQSGLEAPVKQDKEPPSIDQALSVAKAPAANTTAEGAITTQFGSTVSTPSTQTANNDSEQQNGGGQAGNNSASGISLDDNAPLSAKKLVKLFSQTNNNNVQQASIDSKAQQLDKQLRELEAQLVQPEEAEPANTQSTTSTLRERINAVKQHLNN